MPRKNLSSQVLWATVSTLDKLMAALLLEDSEGAPSGQRSRHVEELSCFRFLRPSTNSGCLSLNPTFQQALTMKRSLWFCAAFESRAWGNLEEGFAQQGSNGSNGSPTRTSPGPAASKPGAPSSHAYETLQTLGDTSSQAAMTGSVKSGMRWVTRRFMAYARNSGSKQQQLTSVELCNNTPDGPQVRQLVPT